MEQLWQVAAIAAVLVGTAFSVVGVLGFLRLPDVFTRLHATGKVSVFGVMFLLLAAIAWTPLAIPSALVLIVLLAIAGPVASHALASAAYRVGIPPRRLAADALAEQTRPAATAAGDQADRPPSPA